MEERQKHELTKQNSKVPNQNAGIEEEKMKNSQEHKWTIATHKQAEIAEPKQLGNKLRQGN